MDSGNSDPPPLHSSEKSDVTSVPHAVSAKEAPVPDSSSGVSTSSVSSWTKSLKLPQMQQDSQTMSGKFTFSRLASELGLQKASASSDSPNDNSTPAQSGILESFKKGIVDSSMNAVKAVQVKARHVVSQNKRRYQVVNSMDL